MLKLKKIKKIEPLKERVYNILLESIVENDLSPGEPLTEMTLAKRLGVSKSPIRDALHHLEGDGLVINIPYKGFYVAKLSVKEFNELMDVRMAIEVFCLEQTIESYSDNDIDAFVATMNQASLCREKGRDRSAHEEHLNFHLKVVEKFGNELMLSLY